MKKKLFAAVVSLVVATVMMTSASFAWFTVSTAPEIEEVKMKMEATKNLEIAKATDSETEPGEVTTSDSGDETTWGGVITSFEDAVVQFPAALITEGDTTTLNTIAYDEDYRTNGVTTVSAFDADNMEDGTGYYTADIMVGEEALYEDAKVAAVYGVWLRTNTDLSAVTFTADTEEMTVQSDPEDEDAAAAITWAYKPAEGGGLSEDRYEDEDAIKFGVVVGETFYDNGDTFELEANEATFVQIVIYVDGDCCIAESIAEGIDISGVSITFDGDLDDFATQHGGEAGGDEGGEST